MKRGSEEANDKIMTLMEDEANKMLQYLNDKGYSCTTALLIMEQVKIHMYSISAEDWLVTRDKIHD